MRINGFGGQLIGGGVGKDLTRQKNNRTSQLMESPEEEPKKERILARDENNNSEVPRGRREETMRALPQKTAERAVTRELPEEEKKGRWVRVLEVKCQRQPGHGGKKGTVDRDI